MGRKKRLPRLQDVVTWGEMTDNQVIFNHNGTFQKTYIFRGADGSNMTEDGINSYYVGLNNIFMRLKRNYYIFVEMHKRRTDDVVHSHFDDDILEEFEEEREKNISTHQIYDNEFYLTICYKWPSEVMQRASRILDKSNKEILKEVKGAVKEFSAVFTPLSSGLDEIMKDQDVTYDHFAEMEAKFLE